MTSAGELEVVAEEPDGEPCVCHTPWTCMADTHDQEAHDA